MKFLEREVRKSGRGERLSYYHAHWTRAGAPLLDELGAVIDHVEGHSAGGASTAISQRPAPNATGEKARP